MIDSSLSSPKKFSGLIWTLFAFSMVSYFVYHLFQGERGIISMIRLQKELEADEKILAHVQTERNTLEQKVNLLGPNLDLDMLEERVRAVLHFALKGEVVINEASLRTLKEKGG